MSEVELALNVVFIILNIPFIIVVMLMIDEHFKFEEYKSLLTAVQRNGMLYSVEQENEIVYGNEISHSEMLDILASVDYHKLTHDYKFVDAKDSPWRHERVNALSGDLQDLSMGSHPLYQDTGTGAYDRL